MRADYLEQRDEGNASTAVIHEPRAWSAIHHDHSNIIKLYNDINLLM